MSKTYRPYKPDQMYLMPPSLQEWLPDEHMVFFLRDVLETVDLSPISSVYEREERGSPPYHPTVMVGILLYGYCHGITSSRKLAVRCLEDVAFRVLAANNAPDFRTISDFRKRHLATLHHLFIEILSLCRKAGLVKFGHVALDGTKVKANASQHKAMSYGRMKQDITRLEKEIAEAEATDAREDARYGAQRRGDELPAELARRETRLAKIKEAKRALEEEARNNETRDEPQPPSAVGKPLAQIKTELDKGTGEQQPVAKAQRNFTDPESRIMPSKKTFIQGYNIQVAVDDAHQIIVGTYVTNCPNDYDLMPYMLSQLPKAPKLLTADAGYPVEPNLKHLKKKKIDAYIAVKREKHYYTARRVESSTDAPAPRGRIPKHLSAQQRMERKLLTKKGKRIYAKRKSTVEPVIGQIKHAQGFRQFSLRSLIKAEAEWFLVAATHNLRKLFAACKVQPSRPRVATLHSGVQARRLLFAG